MDQHGTSHLDLPLLLSGGRSPHAFAVSLATSLGEVVNGGQVLIGITDLEGDVYRIKAAHGFHGGNQAGVVEVPRRIDTERASAETTYYRNEVPAGLNRLFSEYLEHRVAFYVRLDAPELAHISLPDLSKPMLFVAVAVADPDTKNAIVRLVEPNLTSLGILYLSALNEKKLATRASLVDQANQGADLTSLLYRSCRLLCENYHIDAVIALAPSDSGLTLDVRALYPREGGIDLQHHSLPLTVLPLDPVSAAFRESRIAILSPEEVPKLVGELLPEGVGQHCVVPLVPLSGDASVEAAGVLICAGKTWDIGSGPESGTFLWEDITLLEFFADMLAILVRMLRARDDAAFRVERVLHGAKAIFRHIRNNLTLLEENGVSTLVPSKLVYMLPDSIALLEDLSYQLERKRLSGQVNIETKTIRLYGDVLATTSSFATSLARAMGRNTFRTNSLEKAGFRDSPWVRSNAHALTTVFRNLVHNAVKYSVRNADHHPWLDFSWRVEHSLVVVAVSDNGIGIPEEEWELVFAEGYRSELARKLDPTGIGVGLPDCREIMKLLDGSIEVVAPAKTSFGVGSTTIEVSVPVSSR